ncbi:MAG: DUF402 domain-containing protein [Chloroflexi bacterium]|nr:DUF402 domain-containing protein [Chloroflexota bacterium]
MRWKPGDQIVVYEMWGRGVACARPVTVVEDVATYLALYSHPGVKIATRGIPNRRSLSFSERIEMMIRGVDPTASVFREVFTPSHSHVLMLTPPDSGHAVWLFWSQDWEFKRWYVNLQSPLRRVRHGVQLHDHVLDIIARPDMSWTWKDTDEFEALIARGFFSAEQESSIRDEAAQMVHTIESVGRPFCDGWADWRPEASWATPLLPDDWSEVDGTEAGTS